MEPPRRFTCPFRYVPHPLCVTAAHEVRSYLDTQPQWLDELADGKMMGVLVVDDEQGERGFLAAFSGTLQGSSSHDYFVPPVYDILEPDGEFRRGEREITALNRRIEALEHDPRLLELQRQLDEFDEQQRQRESDFAQRRDEAKERRDAVRAAGSTYEELRRLIAESQWFKAEMKRIRRQGQAERAVLQEQIDNLRQAIQALKHERKAMSEDLQRRIFDWFEVVNARGECASLLRLFDETAHRLPPAGAGECCAPRLLQYAFTHSLRPLCMAEFWVGGGDLRRDGNFYPACDSKCRPILNFMLQGLDVDDPYGVDEDVKISVIYEDEWMMVVNKPAGVLSVPGRDGRPDVAALLGGSHAFLRAAHRLDMDTSGLLVLAKNEEVLAALQRQFEERGVEKTYEALIVGTPPAPEGTIDLPISADYEARPLQRIDHEHGQPATTRYRVLTTETDTTGRTITRLELRPFTGRTHQLRLHCASPRGLNAPILGDPLYNNTPETSIAPVTGVPTRMCLHAHTLSLIHPLTGVSLHLTVPTPF